MEEFIKEIEARIQDLKKDKTRINLARVFELTLVVERLKALILPVVVKSLKEKEPNLYDWIKANNYKKMWHGIYKKDEKVYLTRELLEKYNQEIKHQL